MGLRSTYRRCRFCQKIIFSDEAHFDLGGYVNKQNCRIWGTEKHPIPPKRVTVWCVFWAVTVNGDRYRTMLNEFLFTKIEEEDIDNILFQQDGATLDVLRPVFKDRIISRRAIVVWPPRSCDLTPLDYYLWGALKDVTPMSQRQLTL